MSLTQDMSRLADELRTTYDGRIASIDALHAATDKQLAELHAQHSTMAASQRQQLQKFAETLRRDVAHQLTDLKVERAALSADQRRTLEAYTSDLRKTTNQFLAEQAAARKAMRIRQGEQLDHYTTDLRQVTKECLAQATAARQAIHSDHAAAHETWRRFNGEMRQRRASHG